EFVVRIWFFDGCFADPFRHRPRSILDNFQIRDAAIIMQSKMQRHLTAIVGGIALFFKQTIPRRLNRGDELPIIISIDSGLGVERIPAMETDPAIEQHFLACQLTLLQTRLGFLDSFWPFALLLPLILFGIYVRF